VEVQDEMKKLLVALSLAASLFVAGTGGAQAAPQEHFRRFLDTHPAVARELYQHPEYLHNHGWVVAHPEFQQFLALNPGLVALPAIAAPFPTWYPLASAYQPSAFVSYNNGNGFSIGVSFGGGYGPAPEPVYAPPLDPAPVVYSAPAYGPPPVYTAPVVYPAYSYSQGNYYPHYYGPAPVVTHGHNWPSAPGHAWTNSTYQGYGNHGTNSNTTYNSHTQPTQHGQWEGDHH
jgi:hypothetical protein